MRKSTCDRLSRGGLLAFLILLAILYIASATTLFMHVYKLSRKYGQHGMMKTLAKRNIAKGIKNNTQKAFTKFL